MGEKVLFIYSSFSSFVKTDFEILSSKYKVVGYHYKSVRGIKRTFIELIKQNIFLIKHIWQFDTVFIWFADHHSFFPVLYSYILRKKSCIVIGGFDAVALSELKYGLFESNILRKFFGKMSIKWASYILPVDKSLIKSVNTYASLPGLPVGVKHFVNGTRSEIKAIPTGYDVDFWKEQENIKRDINSVVTVGYIPDWMRWRLKGCDILLDVAKETRDYSFHIYGLSDTFLKEVKKSITFPSNVFLYPMVERRNLPEIYSSYKVYAQFSLSEGFPNVLCEAILCGCVPVGSNVNGIPTIIKDKNLILNKRSLNEAKKVLNNAVNYTKSKQVLQYNYVSEQFTINNRKKAILDLIQD